jgi:hypothetical protein
MPIKNTIPGDKFLFKNNMKIDALHRLEVWFDTYTQTFLCGDTEQDFPLTLKIEHTARVRENIRQLARRLSLGEENERLADAVALFHDVGRFEQYRTCQTFNDARSFNHAIKAVDVLDRAEVLAPLSVKERNIIIDAVRFHNAPALPDTNGSDAAVFMRLIRDADKLDIWKVFADCYRRGEPYHPTIVQHVADHPTWEPAIVRTIMGRRTARLKDMRSLNDLKLLQLSWVFGIHFPVTAVLASERGDLAAIASTLPPDGAVQRAVATVMSELASVACQGAHVSK